MEALQSALRAQALPYMVPKFPTHAGRAMLPKYASAAGIARRGIQPPTVFETVMLKVQKAVNA